MKNMMIDIETLATSPNAIILSIAAVKFNFGDDRTENFSVNIDPKSCAEYGMIKDPETIQWWQSQRPDALKAFMSNQIQLKDALSQLTEFSSGDTVWWCNGMNFDYPILEWSYKALGMRAPWKYWNLRDARTMYAVCDIDMKNYPRVGTYHNALDDCLTQIKALKECLA
jgi:3' exoribonuclease, RNase T-like